MITLKKRIELVQMLPKGSVIAEIGVWRAYFSIEILNECPNIAKLFLVDSWEQYADYDDTINAQDQEENLRQTKHHIRGHLPGGRVEIIRGRSLDVAQLAGATIPPLDAFYLDANHSEEAAYADLVAWSKRLKPTGVILGHDYFENEESRRLHFGVVPAVTRFCGDYGWDLTHVTDEGFPSFRLQPRVFSGAEL